MLGWVEAGKKAMAVTVVSGCALSIESNLVACLGGGHAGLAACGGLQCAGAIRSMQEAIDGAGEWQIN